MFPHLTIQHMTFPAYKQTQSMSSCLGRQKDGSQLQIRMINQDEMSQYAPHRGENINTYKVLVRQPEQMKQAGRFKHRWKNNIKTDLRGSKLEVNGLDYFGSD